MITDNLSNNLQYLQNFTKFMKRSGAASFAWEKVQQEQLLYEDTGTPDTTKHVFRENQIKETLATIIMLPGFLSYQSMALGEPEAVVRFRMLEKMVQPCGPEPEKPWDMMAKAAKEKLKS